MRGFRSDLTWWEPYGGLGDALAYSNLPELAHSQLRSEFYLSTLYKPRNIDILDLVWGQNPYVAGWSRAPATLGFRRGYKPTVEGNFISDIEMANGFPGTNRRPKIYYNPSQDAELENKVLVDFSSVTIAKGRYALSKEILEREISSLSAEYVFVLPARIYGSVNEFFPSSLVSDNVIEVSSLFEYCDLLASSSGLVGVQSGAVSLAVAILEYNPSLQITALMHPDLMSSSAVRVMRNHIFSDVTYKVPSGLS